MDRTNPVEDNLDRTKMIKKNPANGIPYQGQTRQDNLDRTTRTNPGKAKPWPWATLDRTKFLKRTNPYSETKMRVIVRWNIRV
jgi:hypothetical protein